MELSMNIANLATMMNIAELSQEISTAVLGQSLDMIETMGEGMIKIMESSVNPELGQNIDVRI